VDFFESNMGSSKASSENDRVHHHVTQVYALTFVGCAIAALGSKLHLNNSSVMGFPIHAGFQWTIIQAIAIFIITASNTMSSRTSGISMWRAAVFLVLAFSAGVNVGSWFQNALQEVGLCKGSHLLTHLLTHLLPYSLTYSLTYVGSGFSLFPDMDFLSKYMGGNNSSNYCSSKEAYSLIFEAIATTAGIYFCFAFASYLSPGWSKFVGLVTAGFWVQFASSLFALMGLISNQAFEDIYVKGGLILYSLKVMVDTDILLENARKGYMDVVGSACNTMMNILHLLIRVVTILGDLKKKKKNRD
jgi:hypothetical protein